MIETRVVWANVRLILGGAPDKLPSVEWYLRFTRDRASSDLASLLPNLKQSFLAVSLSHKCKLWEQLKIAVVVGKLGSQCVVWGDT